MADEEGRPNTQPQKRQLRERTRKHYTDDWTFGEELDEGRSFSVEEKISSEKYDLNNFKGLFKEMNGPDLTVAYLQKNGLHVPLLIKDKTGLGIQVPSKNFSVHDVRTCVGSRRMVDVMDVSTQKNEEMTMKEWQRYYEDKNKERLLNVISLEFSRTKLENYVQSPRVVREVDWVDVVWPRHLKEAQVEATNSLDDMMYPKVQKYCLMSVKGCYTDFHVDFGGTSVWYHILKGSKIFWLIPPTEKNLSLYQNWVLSGKQSDVFFGDLVDRCGRITISDGMTMFIPTGWIHAVFTPDDSLVFGGNFLHSFGIDKQLRVAQVEEATKVPHKFRYPFFTEMLWYVLERYVHVLLGRTHLDISETQNQHITPVHNEHLHLTPFELHGLKTIVMYLHSLPSAKKNVPDLIKDPVALIHDVRCLVEKHRHDSPELAVTGTPVLQPPPMLSLSETLGISRKRIYHRNHSSEKQGKSEKIHIGPRRRRTRCKNCDACLRTDCGECVYCLDMVKFGGSGRAKQTCLRRQCLRPNLPITASCKFCSLDGWGQTPSPLMGKPSPTAPSTLMECSICYDIAHQHCYQRDIKSAVISDDLPNSWECPDCCESGRNLDGKSRTSKARARKMSLPVNNSSSSATVDNNSLDYEEVTSPSKKIKEEVSHQEWSYSQEMESNEIKPVILNNYVNSQVPNNYILNQSGNKKLKQISLAAHLPMNHKSHSVSFEKPYIYNKTALQSIFKSLNNQELSKCACVCRTWARYANDPSLWKTVRLSARTLTSNQLTAIALKQPENLILERMTFGKVQLTWLFNKLTHLKSLSLQGCNWYGVCALNAYSCPPLKSLDLTSVTGLNDASVREIFSPPSDLQPGLVDRTSRLKNLENLSLANCDITDVALRYITQHLPRVSTLNFSSCKRITDAGIAQLASSPAPTVKSLVSINLSNCTQLSDLCLEYLLKCENLKNVDLRYTFVSQDKVMYFVTNSNHNLDITDDKLVKERKINYLNIGSKNFFKKTLVSSNDKNGTLNTIYTNNLVTGNNTPSNLYDNLYFQDRRKEMT